MPHRPEEVRRHAGRQRGGGLQQRAESRNRDRPEQQRLSPVHGERLCAGKQYFQECGRDRDKADAGVTLPGRLRAGTLSLRAGRQGPGGPGGQADRGPGGAGDRRTGTGPSRQARPGFRKAFGGSLSGMPEVLPHLFRLSEPGPERECRLLRVNCCSLRAVIRFS